MKADVTVFTVQLPASLDEYRTGKICFNLRLPSGLDASLAVCSESSVGQTLGIRPTPSFDHVHPATVYCPPPLLLFGVSAAEHIYLSTVATSCSSSRFPAPRSPDPNEPGFDASLAVTQTVPFLHLPHQTSVNSKPLDGSGWNGEVEQPVAY